MGYFLLIALLRSGRYCSFQTIAWIMLSTMYEANVYYNKYTYVWIGVPALWLKAPDINKVHHGWKLTRML